MLGKSWGKQRIQYSVAAWPAGLAATTTIAWFSATFKATDCWGDGVVDLGSRRNVVFPFAALIETTHEFGPSEHRT